MSQQDLDEIDADSVDQHALLMYSFDVDKLNQLRFKTEGASSLGQISFNPLRESDTKNQVKLSSDTEKEEVPHGIVAEPQRDELGSVDDQRSKKIANHNHRKPTS